MTVIKYLSVGILNTVIGLGLIYGAMYFLRWNVITSNAVGYTIGILISFSLNKRWTFNNDDHVVSSFVRYILVLAVAYLSNLATVLTATFSFSLNPYLTQAFGVIPYTTIGYLGSRYFAFRTKKSSTGHENEIPPSKREPIIKTSVKMGIVVPCYNEEKVLPETTRRLNDLLKSLVADGKISPDSRVYYVDDGSYDGTWAMIESLAQSHEFVKGIKLSRNRGHQNALLAGLLTAEGEIIISIDADLQDDLSAIKEMIDCYRIGYDIVYGVRASRQTDTLFKNLSARAYYRLLNAMGVEVIYNHADFRLMGRRTIEALREFTEVNLFLRAIIPQLGYSYAIVYYDRTERYAGESKYPLKKMISLAWQGITSFSDFPLRFITVLGVLISILSFLITLWVFWVRFATQEAIPGWASTVLPIYFLGGIQLLCLGIIGEYLSKSYMEVKRRPRYIIEKTL